MKPGEKLRISMKESPVIAPFVVDGLQAIMAEQAGYKAVYMTGFGAASTLGLPDVGLLTLTQMCDKLRAITSSSNIPVVADADTGYGNYVNVYQTVREYERAGAAALHLEDQVWPKRCGYMNNKQVIALDEAVTKIKAAVDARMDNSFLLIARTDALAVGGWSAAEERIHAYIDAGADMAFVDGIKTLEDMENYGRCLAGIPALLNNVPMFDMEKIKQYTDFRVILSPIPMAAAWLSYQAALENKLPASLLSVGGQKNNTGKGSLFEQIICTLGAPKYFEMDQKYAVQNKEDSRE